MSVVGFLNEHPHLADKARGEMLQVRERIKRKVQETEETPQQILGQEMQQMSQQAAVQMVPIYHVRHCLRMQKQKKSGVHPVPSDRSFDIQEEYRKLTNGEILFCTTVKKKTQIDLLSSELTLL